MADVLTIDDVIADKKHSTFFAEVVTGKTGGLSTGADISTSTNPVTGQIQKTLPQALADLGMVVQTWTATSGGTLTNAAQVFLNDKVGSAGLGNYYAWSGTFPKTVPAGIDPAITAGFIMRSDAGLRCQLASVDGDSLMGYATYAQIRAYSGALKFIRCGGRSSLYSGDGAHGKFYRDDTDTTSADNDGTILIDASGRRWKRKFSRGTDVRWFGADPSGNYDSSSALQKALNSGASIIDLMGGTYLAKSLTLTGANEVLIKGPGILKIPAGTAMSTLYQPGSILAIINSYNVTVDGVTFDNNRANILNTSTGWNMGVVICTGTGDFRSISGGDTKPNKNIRFRNCKFYRTGTYPGVSDRRGDGIYAFGVDGLTIEDCYFNDMGRWGVAVSDCFDIKILGNTVDNTTAGNIALGAFDLETESTDQTYGTSIRDAIIANNTCLGRAGITVTGYSTTSNNNGATHYLRNVLVTGNDMYILSDSANGSNLAINVSPGDQAVTTNGVQNENITISNNIVRSYGSSALDYGIWINLLDKPRAAASSVRGVKIFGNQIMNCARGIVATDTIQSGGWSIAELSIHDNDIDTNILGGMSAGIGVRCAVTNMPGLVVRNNRVRGCNTRGINIEDGWSVAGATGTTAIVDGNYVTDIAGAITGNSYFLSCYSIRLHNNVAELSQSATANININTMPTSAIVKNFGNSWNTVTFTMNPGFIAAGGNYINGSTSANSFVDYSYDLRITPPYDLLGLNLKASLQGSGTLQAYIRIDNPTAYPQTLANNAAWRMTAQKL